MVDAGYNSGRRAVGQGEFPSFPSGQTSIQHRHIPMTKNLRNRQHRYTTLITSGLVSHPPSSSTRLSVPRISQNQHCCRTLPRDVHYQHPAVGKRERGRRRVRNNYGNTTLQDGCTLPTCSANCSGEGSMCGRDESLSETSSMSKNMAPLILSFKYSCLALREASICQEAGGGEERGSLNRRSYQVLHVVYTHTVCHAHNNS